MWTRLVRHIVSIFPTQVLSDYLTEDVVKLLKIQEFTYTVHNILTVPLILLFNDLSSFSFYYKS